MTSSTAGDDAYLSEILERSKNMEKILRYHVEGISFDTETLKNLADAISESENLLLSERGACSNSRNVAHDDAFDTTEDLSMDEKFTVQPLGHNATRSLTLPGSSMTY